MGYVTSTSADGTITVSPQNEADQSATVVFAHGLGDSAEGFVDVAENLANKAPHMRFILPTAKKRPVTLNMGMSMNAWYDIVGMDERSAEKCDGIQESRDIILNIIESEAARGVPHNRIILAGFSQGAAMSLYTGLQLEASKKLAGIVALSGYLPAASSFKLTPGLEDVPVLHCHGTQDPMIQYKMAEKTKAAILAKGLRDYDLRSYPCPHTVTGAEWADVWKFISKLLPPLESGGCVKVKAPSEMSVKELKAAIRRAGIGNQAIGFYEKGEFVKLLENHLASL
eukprot:CAMPEP_0113323558 /NCGR_PEP_ID=MMETSP0010_2-20120614/16400_1 /TAXON_ID=216773 ORGANISM="Corethron hystrix, Strain 308" /NCGR_SAMPLE_ID=MMETSP0010_2 /ASSEMBLY_ACC=CAM_ASM_000155 /LENGTH=283 /DNA_ID=CAMNT_0000182527 /DNA_START=155 /DNA_END=1006 /DNA_ORIENTATION=- /assembly_acc=CAM_ASM_000155